METVVTFDNVSKSYKDFFGRDKLKAVSNISFEVERGEIFGLLGPNGSGKTTSLKLMLGLVFQTGGKIWIFDKDPSNVNIKNRIGFLPEESYLYNFLTAKESLTFYANLFNIKKEIRDKRVEELLDHVGLREASHRPVKEFSKGMSRRLGLAQSLVNDPDLLLLDEPTSGLDPIGCHEVKDLIRKLKAQGKTIILCSHLLADVEDVCDRIAILNKGRIQVIGEMKELLVLKDRLQLCYRGGDESTKERLISVIEDNGGEVISFQEERSRLEDLFIKTIEGEMMR